MAAEAVKERTAGVRKPQRIPFSALARDARSSFPPKEVPKWPENPCVRRVGRNGLSLTVRVPFRFNLGALQKLKVHETISVTGETLWKSSSKTVTITERPVWPAAESDVSAAPVDKGYDALRAVSDVASHKGWAPNPTRRFYLQRLQGEETRRLVRYEPCEGEARHLVAHRLVWAEDVSGDGLQKPDVNALPASDSASSGSLASNPDDDRIGGLVGALAKTSLSADLDPVLDAAADAERAAENHMVQGGVFKAKIVYGKVMHLFPERKDETTPLDVQDVFKHAEGKQKFTTIFSSGQTLDEFEKFERIIQDSNATFCGDAALIDVEVVDLRHSDFLRIKFRLDAKNDMAVLKATEHRGKFFAADLINIGEQHRDTRFSMAPTGRREIATLDPDMISAAQAVAKSLDGSTNPDPSYRFVCHKTIHDRRVYVDEKTKIKYVFSKYLFPGAPECFAVKVRLQGFEGRAGCADVNDKLAHLLRTGVDLARRFAEGAN